jgi:hypothetical protein
MVTSYRGRSVTEAIIAVLSAPYAGLTVGDGEKPAAGGWAGAAGESSFRGYVVVHPIGVYEIGGTLADPSADVWPLHQITAYGAKRAQCEEIADDAREVMLNAALIVAGRRVSLVQPDGIGLVTRLDEVQPPIFMAPDRYMVCTTPT